MVRITIPGMPGSRKSVSRSIVLEHIRQLNAINTMVGTAQANTQTAGMFGKGSEEHGQPSLQFSFRMVRTSGLLRTQDTEQKCIAPYYYKDTHLQGFRCSHWLVGGCTQDYGSFTVAALGGKLRLQLEQRATAFSSMKMKSLILTTMLSA